MGMRGIDQATAAQTVQTSIAERTSSCCCSPIERGKRFLQERTGLAAFTIISILAILVGIGMVFGVGGFSWYSGATVLLLALGMVCLGTAIYYIRKDNGIRTPQLPTKNVD